MTEERTAYRERTTWPEWVKAIFWGATVLFAYPVLAGWDTELPFGLRLAIVMGVLGFAGVVEVLLGGLTVLVQESRIVLHLGWVPVVRRRVPLAEIHGVRSVVYRPIRDFGGWGIRGFGKRKIWSARGNRAVVLELGEEKELFIGSDRPESLAEAIRRAKAEAENGASRSG